MRILVITPGFLPTIGGAEIGVHEIYRRIGERHEVIILTPKIENPKTRAGFQEGNYKVVRYRNFFDLGRMRGKRLLLGALPPFSIGALQAARRIIPRIQPDVINVHYAAYSGLAAIWAHKAYRIPTVLSLIGRDSVPGVDVPLLWPWYSRLVAERLSHTVFISRYCESYYGRYLFPRSIIPYGADTSRIRPLPPNQKLLQKHNIAPNSHILFALQRLNPIKRVDLLLQSVHHLVKNGLSDIILLIGGDGPEKTKLQRLAHSLDIQEHVRFLGFIPEGQIAEYFSLADCFVFASQFETFGIVLAQAMAAGLPVVAPDSSAIPELVEHGVTGLLAAPLDSKSYAQNIARLLKDKRLRQEMSQRARERAQRLYDWRVVADRYEDVLQAVAGAP